MRWISLLIWSRSKGVTKVLCISATVWCVTVSASCSIFWIFATYSSRRPSIGVVGQHLDQGPGALDDERGVLVEEREEPALLRHEHGQQAHRDLPRRDRSTGAHCTHPGGAGCGIVAA